MSTLELRQIGDAVVLILPSTLLEQLNAKPAILSNTVSKMENLSLSQKRASKTSTV